MNKKLITTIVLGLLFSTVVSVCAINQDREMDPRPIPPIYPGMQTTDHDENELDQNTPSTPTITGPSTVDLHVSYYYFISSTDPQGDEVYYEIRCSDGPAVYQTDYYDSGESISFSHTWSTFYQTSGPYYVLAKAIDKDGHESSWARLEVNIPEIESKSQTCHVCVFLEHLFDRFPLLESIIGF